MLSLDKITLKQLRYFVALADKLHFRKAAESMGVAQPSLSAQIADLEHNLGLQLVERGRGGTSLTPAGREIAKRAHRITGELLGLSDLADTLKSGDGGTLRLGASSTIGPYLLPSVLSNLHKKHPHLAIHMWEGAPTTLVQLLLDNEYDVVLTQMPVASTDLWSSALFREPLFLVVPINHPLAKAAAVSPDDLNGSDVLTLGDHYALTEQVRAICYKTGARVLDNYVGNTLDSLRIMTGMDMGVSIMPALYVKSEVIGRDAAVVAVPFKGQNVHRTMGLAWRKSTGKSAAINTVRAFIQNTTSDTFNGTLFVLDGTIA